jgi:cobyrinic acid a,c-diamide synthase
MLPSALPRLLIAAPQGRSGKTTLTLGICSALHGHGMQVQPFKKGPDYIDPSWLSEAAGCACRSLDPFFVGSPQALQNSFMRGVGGAELCIIEGNHGLYDGGEDGKSPTGDQDWSASSAEVARLLSCPVILVVNTERMSRSVAAMVLGYQNFEPETNIAAVILNNVAQKRHESKLRDAIEKYCKIPVAGAIPRDEALTIPDRHLGLVPRGEQSPGKALPPAIAACQQMAEKHLNLELLLEIARSAPPLPGLHLPDAPALPASVRIGVIRDRAFSFYYPENLAALRSAGAGLVFIDALQDRRLPALDGLVIGGGFPEIFMDELSANTGLQGDIREAIESGLPVYAECGGLMYLSQRIHWAGRRAEMVGIFPYEVELLDRPVGHGYVQVEVKGQNPFFQPGERLRGHEFHHSRLMGEADPVGAYHLLRGSGLGNRQDGLVYRNVLASYTHLHADGAPGWAPALVRRAQEYRAKGR